MNIDEFTKKFFKIELIIFLIISFFITLIGNITVFKNIYKTYLLNLIFIGILIGYTLTYLLSKPIKKILTKYYLSKNENIDNDISFEYYRDIIKNYSIATICTCYGRKINISDQLVATLLKLKLNKNIELLDNEIKICNMNTNFQSELMLLRALNGTKVYSKNNIKNQIDEDNLNDCLNSDLFLKDKSGNTFSLMNKFIDIGAILFAIATISLWFIDFLFIIIHIIFMVILFLLIITDSTNKSIFARSEKGIEVQKKLFGLKNYLKDFTNINNKNIKDIELYDDYIIYAIIFNLKGNLNNETNKIYNKYIKQLIN
jgi:hypothetical protein